MANSLEEVKKEWIPKDSRVVTEITKKGVTEIIVKLKDDHTYDFDAYQILRFFSNPLSTVWHCSVDVSAAPAEDIMKRLLDR